jgi:ABC-type Na+ efflux pump permease subunit
VSIITIFERELVAGARGAKLHFERFVFGTLLFGLMIAMFVTHCAATSGEVARAALEHAAEQSFLWGLVVHGAVVGAVLLRGAHTIAKEKDRRTLDFLLGTRLVNAEIVLGKLASCLVMTLSMYAAGIPLLVLLYQFGCADILVILLARAAIVSTVLFLTSLSIWFSVEATDSRKALIYAGFVACVWLTGPTIVTLLVRATRFHLPDWAFALNGWLMSGSPVGTLLKIAMGKPTWNGLVDLVGWMIGIQVIGSCLLLTIAIFRLRSANREQRSSFDRPRTRFVWRLRPRPAVGDDPILWRAMFTARTAGFARVLELAINLILFSSLAYGTYFYAAPAFVEVWNQGYLSRSPSNDPPELNPFVSLFGTGGMPIPNDFARTQFNIFIRMVSLLLALLLTLGAGGNVAGDIAIERARETWTSLLATPLSGRDIVRGKILAALWRARGVAIILVVLWSVGVLAGAVHPVGFVFALVALAAWAWFFVALGAMTAIRAAKAEPGSNPALAFFSILPFSAAILAFLPPQSASVFLGSGSSLFVIWMCLVSFRDLRGVSLWSAPLQPYPHLEWLGINSGDGPLQVILACLAGIALPALVGIAVWRHAVVDFDRLVGRPFRPNAGPSTDLPTRAKSHTMRRLESR